MRVKPADEIGEGKSEADKRYRRRVRKSIENTDADERAEMARDLSDEELDEVRRAEHDARRRAREKPRD
jgi:hypothetical protein